MKIHTYCQPSDADGHRVGYQIIDYGQGPEARILLKIHGGSEHVISPGIALKLAKQLLVSIALKLAKQLLVSIAQSLGGITFRQVFQLEESSQFLIRKIIAKLKPDAKEPTPNTQEDLPQ